MRKTLRTARIDARLSVTKLSQLSGVNTRTIRRLEEGLGEPTYRTVRLLENSLNLEAGTLTFKSRAVFL